MEDAMLDGMRILIVEDEPAMVRALHRGLQAEGFAVDVASNGISGLKSALENDYDAILLDIMLPGLSGYEVVKRLREHSRWIPVLMVSAKDGEYDIADALDLGADDYLTKPFSFVVLLARMRALIRRGAVERPTVLAIGELRIDPASHQVFRGDDTIEMTAREFALLEYLARRPGEAIGKVELLDRVWEGDGEDVNVVEVYIGYLRRKLGSGTIETIRGVGYRLALPL